MTEWLISLPEEQATFLMRLTLGGVLCLGAIIGSFLNVCIYRIPLGQSVSVPRSHCFSCGKTIPWFHNIPVFSWFILRGRCAACGSPISFRYPLIEALNALLFLLVFQMWGNPALFALTPLPLPELIPFFWLFVASTLVNVMIDFDHRILLDRISLGGTVLALAVSAAFPILHGADIWWAGLARSAVGAGAGFATGLIIAWCGERIFLQDAFGFGDVKWMMLFGAIFGWLGFFWILLLACFIGLLMGLGVLLGSKVKRALDAQPLAIPFGPALGAGALLWLFWRGCLLRHYAALRLWVLEHEELMLMLCVPLLILAFAWLIIRIRIIRQQVREEAADPEEAHEEEAHHD